MNDLPTAVVVAYGTIFDQGGLPIDAAVEKVKKLSKTHNVVYVAPDMDDTRVRGLLFGRLMEVGLSIADVWCGAGLPRYDVLYDNNARKL